MWSVGTFPKEVVAAILVFASVDVDISMSLGREGFGKNKILDLPNA
jgi:hypothetical protein